MNRFVRGLVSLSLPFVCIFGLLAQDPAKPVQNPPTEAPATQTPPPAQTPEEAKPGVSSSAKSPNVRTVLEKRNWVRWVSAGATLSVLGQYPIGDGSYYEERTNHVLTSTSTSKGDRLGWGGLVQFRLPSKFAVAVSFALHRSKLESLRDSYDGIDNPNTPLDDRIHTTVDEKSTLKYQDYTLLLRRYNKGHTEAGHRWFYEGGLNLRRVAKVTTNRTTTVGADETTDSVPLVPTNKLSRGFTGGIGAQFVDDFGIRLVPEFRYTRWVTPALDQYGTTSRRNQFEAIVSITF